MKLPTNVDPVELDAATLQYYQAIYKNLTERSERSLTMKSERHKIGFENILNLHRLIEQTAQTMTVIGSSIQINQRSSDDTSDRWSSMEKFRIHGCNVQHVTAELEIVYNFLIQLPHAPEPGQYKITIGLRNALHELDSRRKSPSDLDSIDIYMMSNMATARWEIEYTDLSVARSFSHIISNWYESLPKHSVPFAEKISRFSQSYISAALRVLSVLIIGYSIFGATLWSSGPLSSGRVAIFIMLLYIAHIVSTPLINRLSKRMHCIRSAASLNFTSADADLLKDEDKKRGTLTRWIWANALAPQAPAIFIFVLEKINSHL